MQRSAVSFLSLLITGLLFFSACGKDPEIISEPDVRSGQLRISFRNMFGDSILRTGSGTYVTVNADTIHCSVFKYYISNIVLTNADGERWYEPESYHLTDQSDASSLSFLLNNIPFNDYISVQFMIGVDSARNVSGAQTGALDPAHGMFWTWNSGYIMAKLEGNSPQSTLAAHAFVYHIGGYGGADATQRIIEIPFGSGPAQVTRSIVPEVIIKTDMARWFGPNILSVSETPSVNDFGPVATGIADNYSNMFSLIEVRN